MKKQCSIETCSYPYYAKGYCEKHYQRDKRRGTAADGIGHHAPLETRFWMRVEKTEDCWEWKGPCYKGYGRLWHNGVTIRAHRASWIIHFGDIPAGQFICHRCDNPRCVNPAHLFLGTHQDNMDDKVRKCRSARLDRKGEKSGSAKLSNEDVMRIRKDARPNRVIAIDYGLNYSTISDIKRRKSWKHI